jgi:hypothetical protein
MKDEKKAEQPFFARYLEGQEERAVGPSERTLKFPSDTDEDWVS